MDELADVDLLWADDWFDGPLSGVALHSGESCWFQAEWDESIDSWTAPRRFLLWRLTAEEEDAARVRHSAFESMVSTQYCFHLPSGNRALVGDPVAFEAFYRMTSRLDEEPVRARSPLGFFLNPRY